MDLGQRGKKHEERQGFSTCSEFPQPQISDRPCDSEYYVCKFRCHDYHLSSKLDTSCTSDKCDAAS